MVPADHLLDVDTHRGPLVGSSAHEIVGDGRWVDGGVCYTGFNTVLPPNAASCNPFGYPNEWDWGIYTVASYHPGGAHVVLGDIATKFITDTIDTGNLNTTAPNFESQNQVFGKSPCGAWGALGTRNGGEPDPNASGRE